MSCSHILGKVRFSVNLDFRCSSDFLFSIDSGMAIAAGYASVTQECQQLEADFTKGLELRPIALSNSGGARIDASLTGWIKNIPFRNAIYCPWPSSYPVQFGF